MDLGIVIVNWNVRALLAACLDSIYVELAHSPLSARVCVVDNASSDGSPDFVRAQFPNTLLIEAENRGMGAGNNLGLRALGVGGPAAPFAVLILNPDTLVRPGALRQLVDFMRARPAAGVAAPLLRNSDGSLQHSGFHFPGVRQAALDLYPLPGRLARWMDSPLNGRYPARWYAAGDPFRVDHSLGAAFLVRAAALERGELFDEAFHMYCEEIDAQWRLGRAGWETWIVPGAEIVHLGGQSTAQDPSRSFVQLWTSRQRLYRRYHGPVVNGLVRGLVLAALRGRVRENHRRSQRGEITPDRRAEINQRLTEVLQVWQNPRSRRPMANDQ
ncbi:MAG: glycosyltransferase family 2 protein [Anaerolineales bacterium]|nr:glycosyltransferase family 2 protein [Anaerolineales bacterium]